MGRMNSIQRKGLAATLPVLPYITIEGEKLTIKEVTVTQYCPCHVGPITVRNSKMEIKNIYLYQIEEADAKMLVKMIGAPKV